MTTEKETWNLLGKALSSLVKGIALAFNFSRIHSKKLLVSETLNEVKHLFSQTQSLYDNQPQFEPANLACYILEQAQEKANKKFPVCFVEPVFDIVLDLAQEEGFLGLRHIEIDNFALSEQVLLKGILRKYTLRYQNFNAFVEVWADALIEALATLLSSLPQVKNVPENGIVFQSCLLALLETPKHNLNDFIESFFNPNIGKMGLYDSLREQFNQNAFLVSGVNPDNPKGRTAVLPKNSKLSAGEIVKEYFKYTPFVSLFSLPYDFRLATSWRFEHTHILAGTGYGKTQLLQKLILSDLDINHGFMVIDSQGDLIHKIRSLQIFDPEFGRYKNKLIVIDPEDVEFPASLNIFDLGFIEDFSPLEKQRQINKTIDLYTYMFGALFGSELTAKQGVVFRYIAQLMFEIPNATIQTLRALIENGKPYQQYMKNLDGSAKAFFATEFFSPSFAATKKQVLSRLWAVLSNNTLEKIFSGRVNKVNLFEAMNNGFVVLVNTSKDLLGKEGSAILGRFFIALLSQSVIRRVCLSENQRKPFFAYIDEAQEYFDNKLEEMLSQARKYKVGFVLAHQNLDQLGTLQGAVLTNTTVKMVGGTSFVDSKVMASEMKTHSDTILTLSKTDYQSSFACFVKNITSAAIPLTVEFGTLENEPKLSAQTQKLLLAQNRQSYCLHTSEISFDFPADVEPKLKAKVQPKLPVTPVEKPREITPRTAPVGKPQEIQIKLQGKGGLHHKYLQNLVKRAGQERGFYSTIETPVLEGLGFVDVSLQGFGKRLAVEISVNTGAEWESSNIAKCLSALYDYVILLTSEKDHLQKLADKVALEFKLQFESSILRVLTPIGLITFLDEIRKESSSSEQTIAGYKVKVNYVASFEREQKIRKEVITNIILRA